MSDSTIRNVKRVFSDADSAEEFINDKNITEYFIGPYGKHGNVAVYYKEDRSDQSDPVNHPSHYETGGMECFDAIVASQGTDAAMNFCLCNAFKYIWRCEHKGKRVEDIQKAVWYLNKWQSLAGEEAMSDE